MLIKLDLEDIVMKLVGPIDAVGSSSVDDKRLENLKALTELVDRLLFNIRHVSQASTRQEASMKAIGEHAAQFLADIRAAS